MHPSLLSLFILAQTPSGIPTVPEGGGALHLKLAPGSSAAVLAQFHTSATPLFDLPEAELRQLRAEAERHSGQAAPDLSAWLRLPIPDGEDARAFQQRVCQQAHFDACEIASSALPAALVTQAPRPICPIKTPPYDLLQAYLRPSPEGIDAVAAWSQPGGLGAGVWFADVEGDWNAAHEDLPGARIQHVAGRRMGGGWREHGTAVLGEVASQVNGLGMTGIAPDVARIFTASLGGIGPARALLAAGSRLRPGDVLLIELHGPGPNSRPGGGQQGFVPMEWWDAEYDVIKTLTLRGVIVVEAAGNGAENLDAPIYRRRFDRAFRNSGAIMVGAGGPPDAGYVDRARLDFSNHGARVDVQGWGRNVATLDYGDLQGCSDQRTYTAYFSGTSSASPIVAGAVLSLQGIHRQRTGRVLSGPEMLDLLVSTGSPQQDGPGAPRSKHIGPRPDLRAAIARLPRE